MKMCPESKIEENDNSLLTKEIKKAQIYAAENVVIENLRKKGILPQLESQKLKEDEEGGQRAREAIQKAEAQGIAKRKQEEIHKDYIQILIDQGKLPKEAGLPEEEKLKILKELGNRFNQGKLQWHLVDFKALEPMVKVLMYGAGKYAPDQWKNGLSLKETRDSMIRHIVALASGERIDSESGETHIGHLLCNALFYSYLTEVDKTNARP